jgi:hypothetical protein
MEVASSKSISALPLLEGWKISFHLELARFSVYANLLEGKSQISPFKIHNIDPYTVHEYKSISLPNETSKSETLRSWTLWSSLPKVAAKLGKSTCYCGSNQTGKNQRKCASTCGWLVAQYDGKVWESQSKFPWFQSPPISWGRPTSWYRSHQISRSCREWGETMWEW